MTVLNVISFQQYNWVLGAHEKYPPLKVPYCHDFQPFFSCGTFFTWIKSWGTSPTKMAQNDTLQPNTVYFNIYFNNIVSKCIYTHLVWNWGLLRWTHNWYSGRNGRRTRMKLFLNSSQSLSVFSFYHSQAWKAQLTQISCGKQQTNNHSVPMYWLSYEFSNKVASFEGSPDYPCVFPHKKLPFSHCFYVSVKNSWSACFEQMDVSFGDGIEACLASWRCWIASQQVNPNER